MENGGVNKCGMTDVFSFKDLLLIGCRWRDKVHQTCILLFLGGICVWCQGLGGSARILLFLW